MKKNIKINTFFILVLTLFFIGCEKNNKEGENIVYTYYSASQEDLVDYIETNGSIQAQNNMNVFAPSGGRLEKLYIKEGDFIRKGQLIGLMSSDKRIRVLDMAAHESPEEKAYWRKQVLPTKIFSPSKGKVYQVLQLPGDTIKGPVVKISDKLLVKANVDEIDVLKLQENIDVEIKFDAQEENTYPARLQKISEISKKINNVNVYVVEVLFDEKKISAGGLKARSGMSVTVKIPISSLENEIAIPVGAVNNQSSQSISAELKSGEKRTLELGKIYGDKVHVIKGLKAGDEVRVQAFRGGKNGKKKKSILKMFK